MSRLVRTELLKQRTTRTFVLGVTATAVLAGLVTVAILAGAGKQGNAPLGADSLAQVIGGPAGALTLISLMLGVLSMAGEYRHATITTTFLAAPRRRGVLVAKLAATSLVGAAIGGLSVAISLAIALPWLATSDVALTVDTEVLRVTVGLLGATALYGALGVSIGALTRNQTVAATVVLVWLLAVEELIAGLFARADFIHWLPTAAGRAVVHIGDRGASLPAPAAVVVFAAYVAVLAAAGSRLSLHRDIT